jgi:hypothetical protein
MTSFELKRCTIDLAFTTQSDAVFVSCYVPLEAGFAKRLSASRPARRIDHAIEAFDRIVNFIPFCLYSGIKGVAVFARQRSEAIFSCTPAACTSRMVYRPGAASRNLWPCRSRQSTRIVSAGCLRWGRSADTYR